MRTVRFVFALGLTVAASVAALAQEPPTAPADAQNQAAPVVSGRFSFNKVDGGLLRLDSQNGQVSFCSQRDAGWTCQVVPEDRAALDAEIARLQGEVAGLKSEIAKGAVVAAPRRPPGDLSPQVKDGAKGDPNNDVTVRLPTREEMQRAKAAVERAWKHLLETVSEFQKDLMKKG